MIIIAHVVVKINKNLLKIEKLVVQYHDILLMNWYRSALVYERILAAEGVWAAEGRTFCEIRVLL